MTDAYRISEQEETFAIALRIVVWLISEPDRAQRMLALTGLDPDGLRAGLGQPALLRALIDHLLNHEPDLLACAADLDMAPQEIVALRGRLVP